MTKAELIALLAPYDDACEVLIDNGEEDGGDLINELDAVEDEDGIIYLVVGEEVDDDGEETLPDSDETETS